MSIEKFKITWDHVKKWQQSLDQLEIEIINLRALEIAEENHEAKM